MAHIFPQIIFCFIDANCLDSDDCAVWNAVDGEYQNAGFCNFDYMQYGFCENCSEIVDSDGKCKDSGFITQKGEDECIAKCETP